MTDSNDTATLALLDCRYQLHARIGEGGMAHVYRADDVLLGRTVAIKLLRHEAEVLAAPERARAEVGALAALNHPSLVTLLDARVEPGRARYLVMEYVDGPTLAAQLRAGAMHPADVAQLAFQLASGLHTVHSAGLVHRDVKPSNVLLASGSGIGPRFHVKLTDFGLAQLIDATQNTAPGIVLGTAAYLAPEQVRGEGSRPSSDIYSFGLLLLEALTGRRAFAHTTGIGAIMARLNESPSIPGHLHPEWAALLRAMTAADPALRPSALDVARAVSRMPAEAFRSAPAPTPPLQHTAPLPAGRHVAQGRRGRRRARAATRPWSRPAVLAATAAAAGLIAVQATLLAWNPVTAAETDIAVVQEAPAPGSAPLGGHRP